jgi:hypothetical protein
VKQWGKLGSGPGEFSLPHAIQIDEKGTVYVADRENGRIEKFDLNDNFLGEIPLLGQADIFAMTSSSANDVWAIGSLVNLGTARVSSLFEYWNGTAWTATTVECNHEFLFGASAYATKDAWAVGFATPVAPPKRAAAPTLIEHFDGTSCAVVPSPNVGPNSANQSNRLLGLTANSANDIWAFGSYFVADGSGRQMALLLHWNGTSWTIASSPNPTKGEFPGDLLWAGVAPSPGNVWILGSGHDGTLAIHTTTGRYSSLASGF